MVAHLGDVAALALVVRRVHGAVGPGVPLGVGSREAVRTVSQRRLHGVHCSAAGCGRASAGEPFQLADVLPRSRYSSVILALVIPVLARVVEPVIDPLRAQSRLNRESLMLHARVATLTLFALCFAVQLEAATATWDRNPEANVTGYRSPMARNQGSTARASMSATS